MKISWVCKWVGCGHRQASIVDAYGPSVVECQRCQKTSRLLIAKRSDGKPVAIESRPLPEA